MTSIYGRSAAARIADPANESRVFSWLLDESFDDKGNVIVYEYKREDLVAVVPSVAEVHRESAGPARHLKRIHYGNRVPGARDGWLFTVVFDYGDHDPAAPAIAEDRPWSARSDPFSTCRPGFEVRTYRRCRRILMFHEFAELGPEPITRPFPRSRPRRRPGGLAAGLGRACRVCPERRRLRARSTHFRR